MASPQLLSSAFSLSFSLSLAHAALESTCFEVKAGAVDDPPVQCKKCEAKSCEIQPRGDIVGAEGGEMSIRTRGAWRFFYSQ